MASAPCTDRQEGAGGLSSQYVGDASSPVCQSSLPSSAPLCTAGLSASGRGSLASRKQTPVQVLLAWGSAGPRLPRDGGGDPSMAFPPVDIALSCHLLVLGIWRLLFAETSQGSVD